MKKVLKITSVLLILMVTLLLLSTASNAANITLNEDGYTTPEELLADMLKQNASSLILNVNDNLIIEGIKYIGSDGKLQIDEGEIVITYDSENGIITLTINGVASTTSDADYTFYMRKWSNGTVDSTTPMNITVSNGATLNINCGVFNVCDKSVLTVEEGGTVNIPANSTVTVDEEAQITGAGTINVYGTLDDSKGTVADTLIVVLPTVATPDEEEATDPETTEEATDPETTEEATDPETTEEATDSETTEEATDPETTEEATDPETTEEATDPETTEEATETEDETTSNPTTGDAIMVFAVVFVVAIAGIVVTIKMRKRTK